MNKIYIYMHNIYIYAHTQRRQQLVSNQEMSKGLRAARPGGGAVGALLVGLVACSAAYILKSPLYSEFYIQ